jgi:hypothetical protein
VQRTASCFIQSATTGFTAKGFLSHYRVSPKEAFKGPEPDDGKPSRPVLRGPAPSDGGWLLGSSVIEIYRQLSRFQFPLQTIRSRSLYNPTKRMLWLRPSAKRLRCAGASSRRRGCRAG